MKYYDIIINKFLYHSILSSQGQIPKIYFFWLLEMKSSKEKSKATGEKGVINVCKKNRYFLTSK